MLSIGQTVFCSKNTRNYLFKRNGLNQNQNFFLPLSRHNYTRLSRSFNVSISVFTAAVYVNRLLVFTAIFTMSKNQEQRICLKFCVSNKISYIVTLKNSRICEETHRFCTIINAPFHTSMLVLNFLVKASQQI